jgi:hypothetical protein
MLYFGTSKEATKIKGRYDRMQGGECESQKEKKGMLNIEGYTYPNTSAWMSRNISAFCVTKRVFAWPPTPTNATWEASKKDVFLNLG